MITRAWTALPRGKLDDVLRANGIFAHARDRTTGEPLVTTARTAILGLGELDIVVWGDAVDPPEGVRAIRFGTVALPDREDELVFLECMIGKRRSWGLEVYYETEESVGEVRTHSIPPDVIAVHASLGASLARRAPREVIRERLAQLGEELTGMHFDRVPSGLERIELHEIPDPPPSSEKPKPSPATAVRILSVANGNEVRIESAAEISRAITAFDASDPSTYPVRLARLERGVRIRLVASIEDGALRVILLGRERALASRADGRALDANDLAALFGHFFDHGTPATSYQWTSL